MKRISIAAVVIAFAALPAIATAAEGTSSTQRIDKRQKMQDKRIDRAAKSGALNEKEQARLDKGQQRVQRMEDKATADGKVTARERARIEQAQDRQSKKIYREAHDKQVAK
jgi:hypothetical protein